MLEDRFALGWRQKKRRRKTPAFAFKASSSVNSVAAAFGFFGELDNYGGEAGGQRQSRRGGAGLIPVMARIVINP